MGIQLCIALHIDGECEQVYVPQRRTSLAGLQTSLQHCRRTTDRRRIHKNEATRENMSSAKEDKSKADKQTSKRTNKEQTTKASKRRKMRGKGEKETEGWFEKPTPSEHTTVADWSCILTQLGA